MNELQVIKPSVTLTPGMVSIDNKEVLEQALKIIVQKYKGVVVTDDDNQYKEAKSQRAEINKIIKALDDERKKVKKTYEEPIKVFESEFKALKSIADEAAKELDDNIKAVEQLRRDKKAEEVEALMEQYSEGLPIDRRSQWLNQTYRVADIIDDIKSDVRMLKQEKLQRDEDVKTIQTACDMAGLEADGWIANYYSGTPLNVVINAISDVHKRRKQREEEEAQKQAEVALPEEEITDQEVIQFEETVSVEETVQPIAEEEPKMTFVLEVTGTLKQHELLAQFCKDNGLFITLQS